jgi:hypothetical protein
MEPRTKLIIAMLLVAFGSSAQAIVAWTDSRVTFAAITTAIALGALAVAVSLRRAAPK